MQGILYGVGVGPGDPELMTLKAARLLRECPVIAAPESGAAENIALSIARDYVEDKEIIYCPFPMTHNQGELRQAKERSAELVCAQLEAGRDVAFLTLGDTTIYSTYSYLHRLVSGRGYRAEFVPGVPSFCAAAAALDMPLCEGGESLHIIPAGYSDTEEALDLPGVKVMMKSGRGLDALLEALKERNLIRRASLAQRVGLSGQRLLRGIGEKVPADYLSLVIVREENADGK